MTQIARSFSGLMQEAKQKDMGASEQEKKNLAKEESFMALRNNVWAARCILWKEVTPLEMCLIDLIIEKTIGWNQTEARIKIIEFVEFSGKREDAVYKALRGLRERQVIKQRKDDHRIFFALNEEYFGQLLIKKHAEADQKRRKTIKVVVDNSRSSTVVPLNSVCSSGEARHNFSEPPTPVQVEKVTQPIDIIDEKPLLKTPFQDTSYNTSLQKGDPGGQKSGDIYSFKGRKLGPETEEELEDRKRFLRRQKDWIDEDNRLRQQRALPQCSETN